MFILDVDMLEDGINYFWLKPQPSGFLTAIHDAILTRSGLKEFGKRS